MFIPPIYPIASSTSSDRNRRAMTRCWVRTGFVAIIGLMAPAWGSAQVVTESSSEGWQTGAPRFRFFNISRRQIATPYDDAWQSPDPAFGGEGWSDGGWTPGPWGMTPLTAGCCEPVCDPCSDCCGGAAIGPVPSAVAPGTPRAIPIPQPLGPGTPGSEYVPRNNVPTPIETPDDPNWHKIPEPTKSNLKPAPEPAAPADLPAEIDVPTPRPDKETRRPATPRISGRFVPVPPSTAARVWNLR
jgi:hypothetical protein